MYDHGNNNVKASYLTAVSKPSIDRRTISLSYQETFTGGVEVECVATNNKTDFHPSRQPSQKETDNSVALIFTYGGFDYFTAGDLTKSPERSLATGVRNCDVYHVNHHGSRATSSVLEFVKKLDPEVSVVSNGTRYGHPTAVVANRLINEVNSKFDQTNVNEDSRAHHPPAKFVADDTFHADTDDEDLEGATGNITIVVDAAAGKYYIIMPGLPLAEATFDIEH